MTGGTMKKKSKGKGGAKKQTKKQIAKNTKNKFGAKQKTVDGIAFASKAEAEYYCELKLRKIAGDIQDFELQPKFELLPTFTKHGKKYLPATYTADFKIIHNDNSVEIIEVKGFVTRDYALRAKLFNFAYRDLKYTVVRAR